jgi:AbrB family looped-hinge helix DNA binding protein
MTAHIYGRGQMVIPARARKQARIGQGDIVSVQPDGDGRILLVRLERPTARAPVKGRYPSKRQTLVVDIGRPITREEIRRRSLNFHE